MIILQVTNTTGIIQGSLTKDVIRDLDDECSFEVSGAWFSSKVQQGHWDGRTHLLSTTTQKFPVGLLERVQNVLDQYQIPYQVQDLRIPVQLGTPLQTKTVPWDWQEDVIQKSLAKKRGVIKSPTGSGKSLLFMSTVARLNNPNTLILVNKLDILYQIEKDFKNELGIEVGIIGGGKVEVKNITVAMVQTIARGFSVKPEGFEEGDVTKLDENRMDLIKNVVKNTECLFADEVHNQCAKTYYKILKQYKNAYYKLAYSATPYRTDKADLLLEAAFGPRIVEISCSDLIDKGFLAKPTFYLVKFKHHKVAKGLGYQELYEQEVVNNEERNFLIVKMAKKFWDTGKRVLIVVQQRKHGKLLEEMLKLAIGENNVDYVHGDTDTDIRQETLGDLNKGDKRMVIATKIFSEGVNVPELNVLMNVKAQVAPVDFVQTFGRAMRKTKTKDRVTIVDIYDQGCRYLERHSKERLEILKQEPAFDVRMIDETKI